MGERGGEEEEEAIAWVDLRRENLSNRVSIVFVCDRLVREKQILNYSKGNRKHAE